MNFKYPFSSVLTLICGFLFIEGGLLFKFNIPNKNPLMLGKTDTSLSKKSTLRSYYFLHTQKNNKPQLNTSLLPSFSYVSFGDILNDYIGNTPYKQKSENQTFNETIDLKIPLYKTNKWTFYPATSFNFYNENNNSSQDDSSFPYLINAVDLGGGFGMSYTPKNNIQLNFDYRTSFSKENDNAPENQAGFSIRIKF